MDARLAPAGVRARARRQAHDGRRRPASTQHATGKRGGESTSGRDWHTLLDGIRGLYPLAEKLSSIALRIRKDHALSGQKLYVVAHSAGGLIARYYVQLLGGSHYCDALITLGTPHNGTWVAALGLFTHLILKAGCLIHMLPTSSLIRRINDAAWPTDFPLVSINSRGDYLCYRRAASLPPRLLSGEHPCIKTIELHGLAHSGFLLSKRCYAAVHKILRPEAPEFTASKEIEVLP